MNSYSECCRLLWCTQALISANSDIWWKCHLGVIRVDSFPASSMHAFNSGKQFFFSLIIVSVIFFKSPEFFWRAVLFYIDADPVQQLLLRVQKCSPTKSQQLVYFSVCSWTVLCVILHSVLLVAALIKLCYWFMLSLWISCQCIHCSIVL